MRSWKWSSQQRTEKLRKGNESVSTSWYLPQCSTKTPYNGHQWEALRSVGRIRKFAHHAFHDACRGVSIESENKDGHSYRYCRLTAQSNSGCICAIDMTGSEILIARRRVPYHQGRKWPRQPEGKHREHGSKKANQQHGFSTYVVRHPTPLKHGHCLCGKK